VREERREQSTLAEAAVAEAATGCARPSAPSSGRGAKRLGRCGARGRQQFLRSHAAAGTAAGALEGSLAVAHGYELALAATLGGRLAAAVVGDRAQADAVLERAGDEVRGRWSPTPDASRRRPGSPGRRARALVELLSGDPAALAVAARCW